MLVRFFFRRHYKTHMPSKSGKKGGSGFGSKAKDLRVGDYIREKVGDKRSGRIVGGTASAGFVVDVGEKDDVTIVADNLESTRNTFGSNQFKEILLNSALFASIQGVRKSDTFMGKRSVNFLISDSIYELFLKGFAESSLPMLRPDSIVDKEDREKFFASSDFMNGVAKALPIVLVMQCYGMAVHKHKFSEHLGKNVIDAALACTTSNIIDRKFLADSEKTYSY